MPDALLQQLAELARVPADQRPFFFDSVLSNVQTACELDRLAKGALANAKGKTLQRTSASLYDTLGKLNQDERKLIEEILRGKLRLNLGRISSEGVDGLLQTAYQLASLFSLVTGKPDPQYLHQSPQPRQRGRKPGS